MNLSRIALTAITLAAFSGVAQAQDYKFGGQIHISKPQGDLDTILDGKVGYGLGAHMLLDLKQGHAIVPRLDYLMFKRSEVVPGFGSVEVKPSLLSLGADYNYYVSGKTNSGFYLTAGLAYVRGKIEATVPGLGTDSETKSTVGLGLGMGYMFTPNLGAELKYNHAKFTFEGDDLSSPTINASFVFRF